MQRWKQHQRAFRRGDHQNSHLQRAWNKYGEIAFEFRPLLICAPEHALDFEQRCLNGFKPEYNLCPTAGSCLGRTLTLAHKNKIGIANRGNKSRFGQKHSLESRSKMSAALRGKPLSPEHRAKLSLSRIGKKPSAATRAKMSAARTGMKRTLESIAKTAAANRGRIVSPEIRAKLSAAHRGHPSPRLGQTLSPETRAKISAALIGRVHSPEARANMSVGTRVAWLRRKQVQNPGVML